MSLNPHWSSTMIGVYFFQRLGGGRAWSSYAAGALAAGGGPAPGAVTVEHYHDLGKLTFAFVFFWGYIAFSQYMLIWYANMPEETQFFLPRQIGPWAGMSLALIVVHFVLPFLGLMSKHVKRRLPLFAFWLVWLLVAHAFDLFWLIMPGTFFQQQPSVNLPELFKTLLESPQSVYQLAPSQAEFMEVLVALLRPAAIATVVGLLVAMGGLYLMSTAWFLGKAALVPVKDPRLNDPSVFITRSLSHESFIEPTGCHPRSGPWRKSFEYGAGRHRRQYADCSVRIRRHRRPAGGGLASGLVL